MNKWTCETGCPQLGNNPYCIGCIYPFLRGQRKGIQSRFLFKLLEFEEYKIRIIQTFWQYMMNAI